MNEKKVFYIYNLSDEMLTPTIAQIKEIREWFDKKYLQLFKDFFYNIEGLRKVSPHFFAAEVKAFWDFINGHLFFFKFDLGEFGQFIYRVKKEYNDEINFWAESECMRNKL